MNNLFDIFQISNDLALETVINNHYLKRRCSCISSYGLYDKITNELIGVCIFGRPGPTLARGLFGKDEKDNIFELTRLWVKDDTPKNTESYFLSACIKLFNKEIVVTFADPSRGHIGIIYQACNFLYTGLSFKGKDLKIINSDRSSYIANKTIQEIKDKYGEENVYYEDRERKHRYVYLNCDKIRKKELLSKLKYKIFNYPKKNKSNLIYALCEPQSKGGAIRYIGRSSCGLDRPNEHKRPSSLKKQSRKNGWIKSLILSDMIYDIKVLEELPDFNIKDDRENALNKAERHWIKYYKDLGADLTNLTDGGEGNRGYTQRDETKQLIRQKKIEWIKNNPDKVMEGAAKTRKPHKFIEGIEYKHCYNCQGFKLLTTFGYSCDTWDKLQYMCKDCDNARNGVRRADTPKLSQEEWKASYVARRDAQSAAIKKKYKENPELKQRISKRNSKPIIAISLSDPNDNREYTSALDAKKAGFNNTNVGLAIKYKKPYKGYLWYFKPKSEE